MALCAKGKELLRELQRSDWLPPYNVRDCRCNSVVCKGGGAHFCLLHCGCAQEEQVRQVVEEVGGLHEQIMEKLRCAVVPTRTQWLL